jgi:hypothetical protein
VSANHRAAGLVSGSEPVGNRGLVSGTGEGVTDRTGRQWQGGGGGFQRGWWKPGWTSSPTAVPVPVHAGQGALPAA